MDITAEELLTELELLATARSSLAILVVEGDSDKKLLAGLFQTLEKIQIIAAGTQSLVVDSMALLHANTILQSKLPPTKGVIDRDYLIPLGFAPANPFMLMTDFRDVECMMIQSKTFDSVIQEYLDLSKAKKFSINSVDEFRIAAISVSKQVGALRFWSQSSKTNISFRSLDFTKFLHKKNFAQIDVAMLIAHLQGAQKGKYVTVKNFHEAQIICKQEKYFAHDMLVCRGHDLMSIISIFLKKWCGNNSASSEVNADLLERLFRVGFPAHWDNFNLVKAIKAWIASLGLSAHLV